MALACFVGLTFLLRPLRRRKVCPPSFEVGLGRRLVVGFGKHGGNVGSFRRRWSRGVTRERNRRRFAGWSLEDPKGSFGKSQYEPVYA